MVKDRILVFIQLVFFAVYIWEPWQYSFQPGIAGRLGGILIGVIGLILVWWPILQLRRNLTMYPTPKTGSHLITTGIFAYMRHPIYTGVFLTCVGFAIFQGSITRMVISILLLLFFDRKTVYEEKKLKLAFSEYEKYAAHTSKFFPFLKK